MTPDSVIHIEIGTYRAAIEYPGCAKNSGISTIQAARMSIPFGVVATLVHGDIRFENWMDFDNVSVQALLRKTSLVEDLGLTQRYPAAQGGYVKISFADGSVSEVRQDDYQPVSQAELNERLVSAAERTFGRRHATELPDLCVNLPSLGKAATLVSRLHPCVEEVVTGSGRASASALRHH